MKKPSEIDLRNAVIRWTKHQFHMSSGVFAGRLPNLGDLNSEILEGIYQGLRQEVGEDVAKNFVLFVDRQKDMSASAFIVAFDRFWSNGCNPDVEQRSNDNMQLDAHGDALQTQALFAMATVMGGGSRSPEMIENLSSLIKHQFLSRRRQDIPGIRNELSKKPIPGLHFAIREDD